MTTILGVSAYYHDSAVAVTSDGEIVAAVQEERFSRRKNDPGFPFKALEYCLSMVGGRDKIDAIAYYQDPALHLDRVVKEVVELAPSYERLWPAVCESQLVQKINVLDLIVRTVGASQPPELFSVDHHLSHAASAFYPSPFHAAAIVVADGVGEWATTTIADGNGCSIETIAQTEFPHSLGFFYSVMTQFCGLQANSGEYKLMGLAPYGAPRFVGLMLDNLIDIRPDGSFTLNSEYFSTTLAQETLWERLHKLFQVARRDLEGRILHGHMDIAASAQAVLEEAQYRIAKHALALTGRDSLCLAGGVALNCVANSKLGRRLPGLKKMWIQPASGDSGAALGAALQVGHSKFGAPRHCNVGAFDGQRGSLLGPAYSLEEIRSALTDAELSWDYIDDDETYNEVVARAIAAGNVVARFHGRMEFGPRALGNRSILADPRRADVQQHVNQKIKFRESWRPFAPAVLTERVSEYFDIIGESPYMLLVAGVRPELRVNVEWDEFRRRDADMIHIISQPRSPFSGVTHVDYTARIQTVDSLQNPLFYALMIKFYEITGCGMLVNTSFNVRGEPIVCTPSDAAECFLNTGIELLAIGNHIVHKRQSLFAAPENAAKVQHEPD